MISIRERIICEVVSRCRAAVTPIMVLRQPVIAVPREQAPALLITVESDAIIKRSNDRLERELMLRIISYARDDNGYTIADDLICRAHAALFRDVTLGGLALGIVENDVDYQVDDADVEAIAIPAVYRITYRTLVSDISQGG